jgi:hypothetical protein
MKSMVLIVLVAACGGSSGGGGDDDPSGADPKVVAGGGVTSGPLSGTLHVHVVEVDSATPIAGATVLVGGTTQMTSAAGLATFTGLDTPQTVTATATGHAATTWVGVDGANVTLPLDPSQRTIPTARVTGTIAGWNNLPAPPFGKYTLGLVLYSFLDDPAAPENTIAQPLNGTTPLNTCINTGLSNSCSWQMNTRVGLQIHSAVIVEGDPHGTNNDTSDDTYKLVGYAVGQPMTLAAGQQVTNESLAMHSGTVSLSATFPAAAPGLGRVLAIPELAVGDAGRLVFPLPGLSPGMTTATVPSPTGALAGTYELVALATPSATATTPFSTAFVHDVSGTATIPTWLAPPSISAGTTVSVTGGGNFHTAQLTRGGATLWNITVLDGTTQVALPAITPDPLGAGPADLAVSAAEAPGFDPTSFDVPATKRALIRAAGAKATFTR